MRRKVDQKMSGGGGGSGNMVNSRTTYAQPVPPGPWKPKVPSDPGEGTKKKEAAPKPAPLYTWTFDEKALLIRLFCWIYNPDKSKMTFCRLFWGSILTPITLPMRLVIALVQGIRLVILTVGRVLLWLWMHSGVPQLVRWIGLKMDESDERSRVQGRAREKGYNDFKDRFVHRGMPGGADALPPPEVTDDYVKGWRKAQLEFFPPVPEPPVVVIESKPKPAKPNAPTRIATKAAETTDEIVAWFQEHPQVGQSLNKGVTVVGKILVRGVFYPLMVIVPIVAVSWTAWQVALHWHGPLSVLDAFRHASASFGAHLRHGFAAGGAGLGHVSWVIFRDFLIWVLAFVGMAAGVALLIAFGCLIVRVVDRIWPEKTHMERVEQRRQKLMAKGKDPDDLSVYEDGWYILGDRIGTRIAKIALPILLPIGKLIFYVAKGIGLALYAIVLVIAAGGKGIARGTSTTSKFFVAGHHSIKYRTCPKIEIVGDEEKAA